MNHPSPRKVKMIEFIYSEERVGDGTTEKPFAVKITLHTPSGQRVAEKFMPWEGKGLIEFYPQNIDCV